MVGDPFCEGKYFNNSVFQIIFIFKKKQQLNYELVLITVSKTYQRVNFRLSL